MGQTLDSGLFHILNSFPNTPPNRTDINPRALNTNAPQEIDNDALGSGLDQQIGPRDRLLLRYRFRSQNVDDMLVVTPDRGIERRLTVGGLHAGGRELGQLVSDVFVARSDRRHDRGQRLGMRVCHG